MTMLTKDFPLKVKDVSEQGEFEGYGSVFGVIDVYGEKVMPGAFVPSLVRHKRAGTYPLMLWSHRSDEPIGGWMDIAEDEKGLYVKGKIALDAGPTERRVYTHMKAGNIQGLSIGYREIDTEPSTPTTPRLLKEVDLLEVSVVAFPANTRARVEAVKSADEEAAINGWKNLAQLARRFRDGEPLPPKEFEEILREVGFPRRAASDIVSVGYAKVMRSESADEQEAANAIARLKQAVKAFSPAP